MVVALERSLIACPPSLGFPVAEDRAQPLDRFNKPGRRRILWIDGFVGCDPQVVQCVTRVEEQQAQIDPGSAPLQEPRILIEPA
jgi:hypothetical protein